MENGEHQADVIVVGAGLSGAIAARTLMRAGKRVVVFEGRDRVGGRLLTSVGSSSLPVDRGGQWIGPGQHRMLNLVAELGLPTHTTLSAGKTSFELAGRYGSSRMGFPVGRPITLLGLALAMNRVEKLAKAMREMPPWSKPASKDAPDVSIGTFVRERVWPDAARTVLRSALEGVFCRDAEQVSMNLALYAIGHCGGFAHMQAAQGGAQERQMSDGAGALVTRLAGELGDRIRLSSLVTHVQRRKGDVLVQSYHCSARAQQVIIALPPHLAGQLNFEPPLSATRVDTSAKSVMGHVIKYNLIYSSPFWRKAKLSGTIWSTSGPISVCYDTTPGDTSFGVLSGLSVARNAKDLAALSGAQRRSVILQAIAAHLGPDAAHPLEYFDFVWEDEPLTGGGFSVTLPPGEFSRGPSVFQEAEGPIHFAGTEAAREYPGYMEGAVEAGERAARDVLRRLGD